MWREFIDGFTTDCDFSKPASSAEIGQVEQGLGATLPEDLRSLLKEANGAAFGMALPGEQEVYYFCLVWSTQEILEENLRLRDFEQDYPDEFEPMTPLLFFGSLPSGDPVAFRAAGGPAVVAMSHEDYGKRWEVSGSLRDYLALLLSSVSEAEPSAV